MYIHKDIFIISLKKTVRQYPHILARHEQACHTLIVSQGCSMAYSDWHTHTRNYVGHFRPNCWVTLRMNYGLTTQGYKFFAKADHWTMLLNKTDSLGNNRWTTVFTPSSFAHVPQGGMCRLSRSAWHPAREPSGCPAEYPANLQHASLHNLSGASTCANYCKYAADCRREHMQPSMCASVHEYTQIYDDTHISFYKQTNKYATWMDAHFSSSCFHTCNATCNTCWQLQREPRLRLGKLASPTCQSTTARHHTYLPPWCTSWAGGLG